MSCFACSEKGWRDCNRFRPGVLAVTMLCSACWSSASARRDKARHCLFLRMSGGIIPLTTGSMKVGVDRMHPDTSRRPLFRVHRVDVCGHFDTTLVSNTRLGQRQVLLLMLEVHQSVLPILYWSANRRSKLYRALTFIES